MKVANVRCQHVRVIAVHCQKYSMTVEGMGGMYDSLQAYKSVTMFMGLPYDYHLRNFAVLRIHLLKMMMVELNVIQVLLRTLYQLACFATSTESSFREHTAYMT